MPELRIRGARMVLAAIPTLMFVGLLAGCGGDGGPQQRTTLGGSVGTLSEGLPVELQLRLDSGNILYRERDYAGALRQFEAATQLDPQLAAGWYGVGMTQSALGNSDDADLAMAEVHRLAPEITLEHPSTAAPPNPHPADWPAADPVPGY